MKGQPAPRRRKSNTPTAKSLAELGAERLAQLLYAAAKADTVLMRTLQREMAAAGGDLGEEIDKQIGRVRKATSWLDAKKATLLTRELAGLLDTITTRLGQDQPAAALPRLLDFIGLAPVLLPRRRDGEQALGELLQTAAGQVGDLLARVEPVSVRADLANAAYRVFMADEYDITAGLVGAIAQALDKDGLETLRAAIEADLKGVDRDRAGKDATKAADILYQTWKLTEALSEIADVQGDIDAFIAVQDLRGPRLRDDLAIIVRLLEAGRAQEALAALDKAKPSPAQPAQALADLRIAALDALGRKDEAQAMRWARFQADRSIDALRAYLKRLPDFEDMERETEALDQVMADKEVLVPLAFLVAWPDFRRAASLVRARLADMDGDAYWVLAPAADALAHKEPLAATLLYRQMIDFALSRAKSGRYGHAARHLTDCAGLAKSIADWGAATPHDTYMEKLRSDHGRKYSFWERVKP
jgi:hypothetical protein